MAQEDSEANCGELQLLGLCSLTDSFNNVMDEINVPHPANVNLKQTLNIRVINVCPGVYPFTVAVDTKQNIQICLRGTSSKVIYLKLFTTILIQK